MTTAWNTLLWQSFVRPFYRLYIAAPQLTANTCDTLLKWYHPWYHFSQYLAVFAVRQLTHATYYWKVWQLTKNANISMRTCLGLSSNWWTGTQASCAIYVLYCIPLRYSQILFCSAHKGDVARKLNHANCFTQIEPRTTMLQLFKRLDQIGFHRRSTEIESLTVACIRTHLYTSDNFPTLLIHNKVAK